MVMTTTLRYVTQRSLLAVLASLGGVGLTSPLAAQHVLPSAPIGGPVAEFNLNDIPLAEGEQIVSSSIGEGGGVIQHGGGNYKIVDLDSVPTAAGEQYPLGSPMPTVSGGFPVTGSCASGNCGTSNCGRCGQRRGHTGHGTNLGGHARVGSGGNVCGPTCNPYAYAAVESLYMSNDSVRNYAAAAFVSDEYDYEWGGRYTFGMVPDCRNGYEVTFVGPLRWTSPSAVAGAGIDSVLFPDLTTVTAANLSGFNNAAAQTQQFEAEYLSAEVNRTLIGWEVIKLLYGGRYIQYDEDYQFASTRLAAPAGVGLLRSTTENRMIGAQIGAEMTYPITCRLWSDARARAGAYANFAENTFQLLSTDTVTPANDLLIFNQDDDVRLAGMFEIGGGTRYYFTNNFHVRVGTELWYLTQIASATEQFGNVISRGTGRGIRVSDDVLMFGVSGGAEWKF